MPSEPQGWPECFKDPKPVHTPTPLPDDVCGDRGQTCDMPTADTAADLARYFCKHWCPGCGFGPLVNWAGDRICPCGRELKEALLARCPGMVVEGLRYNYRRWLVGGRRIPDAHAADLLVMAVVRALPRGSLGDFFSVVDLLMVRDNITLPQAVATAQHRAADSEEANG